MLELKTPILFGTLEELQEAVDLGLTLKHYYLDKTYSMPMIQDIGHGEHCSISGLKEHFSLYKELPNAKHWADVRDEYRPKEWYEKEENVGKPIWARDDKGSEWNCVTFKKYNPEKEFKFKSHIASWRYAKPVTVDDLIKED